MAPVNIVPRDEAEALGISLEAYLKVFYKDNLGKITADWDKPFLLHI